MVALHSNQQDLGDGHDVYTLRNSFNYFLTMSLEATPR